MTGILNGRVNHLALYLSLTLLLKDGRCWSTEAVVDKLMKFYSARKLSIIDSHALLLSNRLIRIDSMN